MTLTEARDLVNGPLWPSVKKDFLATGSFQVYPAGDERRLTYLDKAVQDQIALWMKAIPQIPAWRKVIDGKAVRQLKADYPGVYPEVLRYEAYFRGSGVSPLDTNESSSDKRQDAASPKNTLKTLLKLKFPEAYQLCYS